jgi:uncharacterized protein YlxW (UPF0749 family)
MPEWAMNLLVAGGGLGMLGAGLKAWFTAWREDRQAKAQALAADKKAEEERRQTEFARLRDEKKQEEARVERLQAKVESLLMDAAAREREDNAARAERLAMDAKQNELTAATIAALKENTAVMARLKRDEP